MKIHIIANPMAPHQKRAAERLAAGLKRHGIATSIVQQTNGARGKVVACWGWRQGNLYRSSGCRVLVMERAYIGDRFHWTSLGWDGLNGRARFPAIDDGGARWDRHFDGLLQTRRQGGQYVLIMGQVTGDSAIRGAPLPQWYRWAARTLSESTGLPALFRPHPVEVKRRGGIRLVATHGVQVSQGALADALSGAAVVAAWNSNGLTDAALAGIPLIAGDEGAMAWPIAGQGLESEPTLGPRRPWAHRMAWTQWLPEEIESGEAWEAVRTAMAPAAVAA